jgi:hypothetical protein
MKYLVILLILFPMVVFSQTSSNPSPGPSAAPGSEKCIPPCAKNQSCQVDTETGQYACVSRKPSGSQLSPIPTPGPGDTDKDQKESHHNLVLAEKGILICQSKFAITTPELELKCILSNQVEAKANLKELYRNNWKLINAMKTEKGYLYYLDKK